MQTINNFRQLLIAKDVATTTTPGTTIATPATLAVGDLIAFCRFSVSFACFS